MAQIPEMPREFPPQHQGRMPGIEAVMEPQPVVEVPQYKGSGKLRDKVALITGGDSGIGRAVAIYFAKEGADVAFVYLDEHQDAERALSDVQDEGRRCVAMAGDIGNEVFCRQAVQRTVNEFGKLDILVNHAGEQWYTTQIEEITKDQLERTFQTNIFGYFYMTKAALPHLKEGASIINTSSIMAYKGFPLLLDYASSQGAIIAFTRGLATQLVERGIRVNAVAPGPVWAPFIPATFPPEEVKTFGQDAPMGRAAQPFEMAPSYVFLASNIDSSFMTGQVLHASGGMTTCS